MARRLTSCTKSRRTTSPGVVPISSVTRLASQAKKAIEISAPEVTAHALNKWGVSAENKSELVALAEDFRL